MDCSLYRSLSLGGDEIIGVYGTENLANKKLRELREAEPFLADEYGIAEWEVEENGTETEEEG